MPSGRVNPFEYLRPEIIEKFLAGKTGGDLVAEYQQIPRATIYRWLKDVKDLSETGARQRQSDEAEATTTSQKPSRLVLLTSPLSDKTEDSLPDILYLKRKLRAIINTDGADLDKNDSIRVNAINAYLKALSIEFGNKQALIDDDDDTQEEFTDYSKLSDEELTEIYHRKLKEA